MLASSVGSPDEKAASALAASTADIPENAEEVISKSSPDEKHPEAIADGADRQISSVEDGDDKTPLLGKVSPNKGDETADVNREELQVMTLPLKGPSQTQPPSDAPRQTIPPKSHINKFLYEPRPDERSYYQGLFDYVASFVKNNRDDNSEIILPPKLVADKLFLASKIPPEKLRVIWNMATAVKRIESEDESIDCTTEEASVHASPDGSPKSEEEGKLNTDASVTSAAASQMTKRSRSTITWNEKGTLVVMTQPQFNTTVRLIQLFQNRTSAIDAQLKNIDKSKLPMNQNGNKAKGAFMQRKLVKFDQDGLLPAYFAGISGILLAVPGSIEYKANGDNKLIPTNENQKNIQSNRRRTVDDEQGRAMKAGIRRRTVTGEMQSAGAHEMRMKRMEKELMQLKNAVQSLQTEVRQLKTLLPTQNGKLMARVKSTPHLLADQASAYHRGDKMHGGQANTKPIRTTAASFGELTRDSAVAQKKSETQARISAASVVNLTAQGEIDCDEPNTGVESYWGKRDETQQNSVQVNSEPKHQGAKGGKQAQGRLVVREVLSFDPKISMKMSSNIPVMHPSKRHTVRGQSAAQQTQGPPRGSGSTSDSNSDRSGSIPKLRSSVGSTGQTSAGMTSSPGGDYNSSIQLLRSSLGHKGQPAPDVRSNSKEDFNNSLGSFRSSASLHNHRPSAIKSKLKFLPSIDSNPTQPIRSHQQLHPNRRDHPRLSIASAATITTSNGSKNLKASITTPGSHTHGGGANQPKNASPDAGKLDSHSSRASVHKNTSSNIRKTRRPTRDSLTASIRHIVRHKDGSTQQYQEKEPPPSTNAVDVAPLEPAKLTSSDILRSVEHTIKPKKKNILVRRLSSSSFPTS